MKRFIIANIGSSSEAYFIAPHQSTRWRKILTVTQPEQDASFWTTAFNAVWDDVNIDPTADVTTVYHGISLLSKVASYAELESVQNSFYWDYAAQALFIRIYEDNPEYGIPSQYTYGLAVGVIDSSDIDADGLINSTIGGIAYHTALINGGLAAMMSSDNYRYNKMTMDDFNISINNASGLFDAARDVFYKQRVDVFLADVEDDIPAEADDFSLIRSGVVDEISYEGETTFSMRVIDPRRTWDRVVPFDVFVSSDFEAPTGDRALRTIGKVKPLAIGEMVKIPTVPLSADGDTTNTRHCVSTTAYGPIVSLSGVWEIVDDQEVARTGYTFDAATGILTITGTYAGGEVIVSGHGLQLERSVYVDSEPEPGYQNTPQQIAYWLAVTLGAVPNTGGYFDRQSFRDAELVDSDSSLYIKIGGEKLLDLVDRITMSANWAMYAEAGRFLAARISGDSSDPDRLYVDELEAPPSIAWDTENFATRIQFNYRQSVYDERAVSLFDDSREAALIPRYRVTVLAEVTSPVNLEAAAMALKDERYERIAFIPAVIEVDLLETPRWRMFDFVVFNYLMDGRQRLPDMVFRVVGLDLVGMKALLKQYSDFTAASGSVYNIYRRVSGKSA